MAENYKDKTSEMIVLGALLKNPEILDRVEKYQFGQEDFTDRLSQYIFVSINNLYLEDIKTIELIDIQKYLNSVYPVEGKQFEQEGIDYLNKCLRLASNELERIDYYYLKMKKMSLLRTFSEKGIDVTWIYDPNSLDETQIEKQNKYLEEHTVEDIINIVQQRVDKIKDIFKFEGTQPAETLGSNVDSFLCNLGKTPAYGAPIAGGGLMNTLTGGARLGKFYLFSGSTGVGKTRTMLSHMAYLATPEYFDQETGEWVCKEPLPSLFISTELNNDELTSMALAFISGIDENKILGRDPMTFDESSILKHAADVLKESPLYYEVLTDFTVSDIERTIKLNIDKNDIMYCAFDYISTSTSLLAEMSKKAHGVSLREDSILLLLSTKLKDIANEYGVFIESATQLNRTGVGAEEPASTNMLRGASSIADKIDTGAIITRLTDNDKEIFKKTLHSKVQNSIGDTMPNVTVNFFKNRGLPYNAVRLWCKYDLSTCRLKPLFVTDNDFTLRTDIKPVDLQVSKEDD